MDREGEKEASGAIGNDVSKFISTIRIDGALFSKRSYGHMS